MLDNGWLGLHKDCLLAEITFFFKHALLFIYFLMLPVDFRFCLFVSAMFFFAFVHHIFLLHLTELLFLC